MDEKLQRLIDHFEIRELLEAYVHACDRMDQVALEDVYHPDSWDDHGPLKMDGPAFSHAVLDVMSQNWLSATHMLGQSRIKVDGDSAGAETTFFATLTWNDDHVKKVDQMVGRYIDRLERREGAWRIKERRCISEWAASFPITEDRLRHHLFLESSRGGTDLSYEVLGLVPGRARIERE